MPAGGFRYILAKDSAEVVATRLPQEFLHLLSVSDGKFRIALDDSYFKFWHFTGLQRSARNRAR